MQLAPQGFRLARQCRPVLLLPCTYRQRGQPCDLLRRTPDTVKRKQHIRADDQVQILFPARMQRTQRIHRVACTAAVDLDRIQPRPWLIRSHPAHHLTAVRRGGGILRQRLVRRDIRRDKQHTIQPQRLLCQTRGVQVSQMRRIERAAQQSRPHFTSTIFLLSFSRA